MRLLPFEEIYVTAAKILGSDEITLRILSALGISIGARDERGTVGSSTARRGQCLGRAR